MIDDDATLGGALDAIAAMPGRFQVVVADGGSSDATLAIAQGHRTEPLVVRSEPGRARQMNRGASAAGGDILLFLPTETRLPLDAYDRIVAALREPDVQGGNFELAFDGSDPLAGTGSRATTRSSAAPASTTPTRRRSCGARSSTTSAATARFRSWRTTTSSAASSSAARPSASAVRPG